MQRGSSLAGTIEPDIVIHPGNPAEVLDVFDLKFPCPGTNPPVGINMPRELLITPSTKERSTQKPSAGLQPASLLVGESGGSSIHE